MSTKFSTLIHLILSYLVFLSNPCHSETIVKVVVPNAFKSNENIISLSGSFCLDPSDPNGEFLYFSLESHVGSIMVWSTIIPTLSDVDSLFVSVEFDEHSTIDTLHDIPLTEINLNKGDVTFFRWIFETNPNPTTNENWDEFMIPGSDGEYFVVIRSDLIDSFYFQVNNVLGNLLSNFGHISKRKVDRGNCFEYTHRFDIPNYIDFSKNEIILPKLKTASFRVLENIPFYSDYNHFDLGWDYDGEYWKITIFIQ